MGEPKLLACRGRMPSGRHSMPQIGRSHSESTNQNEAQRPDEIEVEPSLRQEFRPKPKVNNQCDNRPSDRHRESVNECHDKRGRGFVTHQRLCCSVARFLRAHSAGSQKDGIQHQAGAMRHCSKKGPERQACRMNRGTQRCNNAKTKSYAPHSGSFIPLPSPDNQTAPATPG